MCNTITSDLQPKNIGDVAEVIHSKPSHASFLDLRYYRRGLAGDQ